MVRANADEGQRFIDNDCIAHVMVDDYSLEANAKGGTNLKVTFSILASTDHAQTGKSMSQLFSLDGGAVGKLWDLLEGTRIVARGTNRKQAIDFDETQLKGRQCVVKVHLEQGQTLNNVTGKYEDDPAKPAYPRIGFNAIWDVWDAKVATVPKDPQFTAVWPQLPGQANQPAAAPAAPQRPTAPAQQMQQTQAPPPAAGTEMNW